jgi:hypothetical protein
MATSGRKTAAQHWIGWLLPVQTLTEAQNLARRYQQGKALRLYVHDRRHLVISAGMLIVLIGVACSAATLVFIADAHPLAALPALLLLPVVLIGNLLVQFYVFFSWLENRALARALARRATPGQGRLAQWMRDKLGVDMGTAPPVPWVLAAIMVFAPLAMLASFAPGFALSMVALAVLAPVLYARFDR